MAIIVLMLEKLLVIIRSIMLTFYIIEILLMVSMLLLVLHMHVIIQMLTVNILHF